MSRLRFRVGEPCIYAVAWNEESATAVGTIFHVVCVGPFIDDDGVLVDYQIENEELEGSCFDWQLRKIDPPAKPASKNAR
jgi:hypothetical protein